MHYQVCRLENIESEVFHPPLEEGPWRTVSFKIFLPEDLWHVYAKNMLFLIETLVHVQQ